MDRVKNVSQIFQMEKKNSQKYARNIPTKNHRDYTGQFEVLGEKKQ